MRDAQIVGEAGAEAGGVAAQLAPTHMGGQVEADERAIGVDLAAHRAGCFPEPVL